MSRLNTMYPNDEFLKDISNVMGKVDSKNETQIKQEIEQIGYKEFYRYYKEKNVYINQLKQQNQHLKSTLEEIREYINKNKYFYSGVQGEDLEIGLFENEINEILQIIDKGK